MEEKRAGGVDGRGRRDMGVWRRRSMLSKEEHHGE